MSEYNFNKVFTQYSKIIKETIQPFVDTKKIFDSQMQSVGQSLMKIRNGILLDFDERIKRIKKGIKETEEDLKVFKVAITELGYPPHDLMHIGTIRSIAHAYKDDRESLKDIIDEFMYDYYNSEYITTIAHNWEEKKLLVGRLPILRSVIMAHNLGMYYVAIPTILSQFEGVLVDAFEITGRVNGKIINILLKSLLMNDGDEDWSFDKEVYEYYKINILVNFEHGNIINSTISRHAILHGGDKNYGTQSNSLKLILLFDQIVSELDKLDIETIKRAQTEVKRSRSG